MRGECISTNEYKMSQTANLTPIKHRNPRFEHSHERNSNYNSLSPISNLSKRNNMYASAKSQWQKTMDNVESKSPFKNSPMFIDTASQSSTYSL